MRNFIINKSDMAKTIFRFIFIAVICFFTVLILFSFTALIISKINFSYEILTPVITLILCISAFTDGFLISRWQKENGLFWGISAGTAILLIVCIAALLFDSLCISSLLFTKSVSLITGGAIGGILGVNIN